MQPVEFWAELPFPARILAIIAAALAANLLVRSVQSLILSRLASHGPYTGSVRDSALRSSPKLATLTGLAASTLTFLIFFLGLGLLLQQFDIRLTEYLVTASVIGLAIGFGSQGLVQDIVIGLTLIFTDAMDVGDMVEVSGQIGRVEKIGLRFTTLSNFLGQTVFIPNRNIATVGRYRKGVVRAYVDVQAPPDVDEARLIDELRRTATAFHDQFRTVLVTPPEVTGVATAGDGAWRFVRVKLRLWPGQGALVETAFRQRLLARMKEVDAAYADWMITVTYRASPLPRLPAPTDAAPDEARRSRA